MSEFIPYGRQSISDEDVKAVVDTLRSDFLTQGPCVPAFQTALKEATGARHAIAVNSATSALHLACMALGLREGDWLWTTPISFAASSNCGLYCGAKVDFVDIEPDTYNMDPRALEQKLEAAATVGKLPKVVVPVHLTGQPCDMREIQALSKRFGFSIIEDASHAVGGTYEGVPVGKCNYSDIAVFSFHPVKIVTTAEGGAALTEDDELARRLELLRSHGITRDPSQMAYEPDGDWYYEQLMLGYNYRLTDLQAALGVSQIKRLETFVEARHRIADRYDRELADLPLQLPVRKEGRRSALHLYVVRVKDEAPIDRKALFDAMRAAGIGVNLHYIPIYRHPYYRDMGFEPLPEAEAYYREAISIPMFPDLSEQQQDRVIDCLRTNLS